MAIHEMFPYLRVRGADQAIAFYTQAFGAKEKYRLVERTARGTRVGHAELELGGAVIMLSEEFPEHGIVGPAGRGGASMAIHLHVDDCDAFIAKAVAAGATVTRAPVDHFYGERSGAIRDPFGNEWLVGHHLEELSPEEMQRRYDDVMKGSS